MPGTTTTSLNGLSVEGVWLPVYQENALAIVIDLLEALFEQVRKIWTHSLHEREASVTITPSVIDYIVVGLT